ncbi:MAG: hypothetical protein J6333_11545, partial [Planctomycetes bacterium]|nr:hypothetical protein [Planctomycetota bacterium]
MTKRRGWGGWLAAFLAFLAVALAGGCGDDAPLPPASFALLADNACAVPLGQPAAFRVLAQAAPRRTALGGYVSAPA